MPSSANLKARSRSSRQAMPNTGTLLVLVAVATLNAGLVCDASEPKPSSLSSRSSSSSSSSSNGQSISTVVATPTLLSPGDAFTLTWVYTSGDDAGPNTTGDLKAFDIDLEHCADGVGTCQCTGASLVSLCPLEPGCVDSDGSYDLVLPSDDVASTGSAGAAVSAGEVYQIRVSLASNPSVFSCGYGFKVQEGEAADEGGPHLADTTTTTSDGGGGSDGTNRPTLTAFPPSEDLVPGQAFTARWAYDSGLVEDGEIQAGAEFAVDLFSCSGGACDGGSCGEFLVALCGQDGCYDPGTGDYDVVIPEDTTPGTYSLYVAELSENGPWDCVQFNVSVGSPTPAPSTEAPLPPSSAPSSAPTTSPTTATTARPTIAPTIPSVPIAKPTAKPTAKSTAAPTTSTPTAPPVAREPGSPGVPPTPVPAKQVCDPSAALSFVYEDAGNDGHLVTIAHASGNRTDYGCVSLTAVWEWLQTGPAGVPAGLLYPVDLTTNVANTAATSAADLTGVWMLRTSIDVTDGVTMELIGTSAGGDCDELRIRSSSTLTHALRGYGGNLDIYKTLIHSWKESSNAPHSFSTGSKGDEPRSYIACVSEVVNPDDSCGDGAAQNDMGECRMDMVDSELGYMGYFGTEAYGITWKVRGFCTDKSNLELFDNVNVYGDITNCDIHHMWYGMYSYGHQGGVWTNNRVHDNHVYGFDPHDDSDYLTIANNTVYNNEKHGIIASKRCNHVSIRNNTVDASGGSGIMLHRSCDDSEIIGNIVHGSADAGIALVETSRTIVKHNVIADGKWGARLTLGATDNQICENVFDNNDQKDIYAYEGADEPEVYPFTGVNVDNVFDSNTINYVASNPVNLEDSDGTVISNNLFKGTGGHFEFDNAHETSIFGNEGDILVSEDHEVDGGSCFAAPTDAHFDPSC